MTLRRFSQPVVLRSDIRARLSRRHGGCLPGSGTVYGRAASLRSPGDSAEIAAEIDFLGLNYYTSIEVGSGSDETDEPERPPGPGQPGDFSEMGWRNTPSSLDGYLHFLHREYAPRQIVVTENGASYGDGPDDHDARRIDYLRSPISAVEAAIDDGVPMAGYFVWSLLDNFEWALGYTQRFGLVWVDRETLERTPKKSYYRYRDLIDRSRM